jgi:small subunit ribosomal protein S14
MASKAKIATNEKKKKLVAKYAKLRKELKAVVSDPESSEEDRYEAVLKLQKLPRNSSPTRVRNRCQVTGRPRGYYRKFAMSRIALRDYGLSGQIPGLTKSSW